MWLPKPIYEALPTIYMVIGVLFMAGSAYLGLDHEAAPAYAGIGVVCLLSGVFVRARRHESRDGKTATTPDESESS